MSAALADTAARDEVRVTAEPPAKQARARTRGRRWADWLVFALLILPAAGWLGWHSVQLIRADFAMMEARATVYGWAYGRAEWTMPQWLKARDGLLKARAITPGNPTIYDLLGVVYTVRARSAWSVPSMQQSFYRQAAEHQEASIARRPRHGWTWAALAESRNGIEAGSDATWQAWRYAHRFAPLERGVQATLLDVGLRSWRKAPPDVRESLRRVYDSAVAPELKAHADRLATQLKIQGWR